MLVECIWSTPANSLNACWLTLNAQRSLMSARTPQCSLAVSACLLCWDIQFLPRRRRFHRLPLGCLISLTPANTFVFARAYGGRSFPLFRSMCLLLPDFSCPVEAIAAPLVGFGQRHRAQPFTPFAPFALSHRPAILFLSRAHLGRVRIMFMIMHWLALLAVCKWRLPYAALFVCLLFASPAVQASAQPTHASAY